MIRRLSKMHGTLSALMIAGILLAGGGAWACSVGCAQPPGSSHGEGSDTGTFPPDGDGGSVCGQEDAMIGSGPEIRFATGARWCGIPADDTVISREGTEIFHPPLV